MILSAAMLLDHVEEPEKAKKIREAVAAVVQEGKVRTYDMMRLSGGPDVFGKGAANTVQMTDAILSKLR
jgi:3-isopropylmalate dehydrogenase